MKDDLGDFLDRIRQTLSSGADQLDAQTRSRLYEARQNALAHQKSSDGRRRKPHGSPVLEAVFPHLRLILGLAALTIGASGTYYWNQLDEVYANEEIDSALLSDELPPDAYLDRGFQAWLERASHPLSQ